MKKIIGYAVVVFCFFMFCSAEAAIFDVTNVTELQNALTAAQSNGQDDTINLAAGTYTVSSSLNYIPSETENFSLTIQGVGAWATILDGGNSTSILRIEQSALSDETGTNANVTITGVTFQNGSEDSDSVYGGALCIVNYYAQTMIVDSVFRNNTAVIGGGALYLSGWDAQITRNTFSGNSSTDLLSSVGGAVYALISGGTLSLDGNTFTDNFSVGSGAGIYATNPGPIVLKGNVLSGNVAGGEGGGAYVSAESDKSLTLSGNKFSGNSGSSGGGALLYSESGPVIISGNIFRDNIASTSSGSDGGGLTVSIFFSQGSLKMVNNLFVDNRVSQRGAGAKINLSSNENQITNNTFVGNSSTGTYDQGGSLGGGMYVKADRNEAVLNIYNNIFWANTAVAPSHSGADAYINDDGFNDAVGCTIHLYNNDFSNIEILIGDYLFQGGNINGNPNLDPDYRLTPGSPCRDTGNNSAPELPVTDLGRDPRVQGDIVDMGAYEWGPSGSLQVTIGPQGVIDAGAQWRVDGGVWHISGETQRVLVGEHTVEFSDVVGWTKPGDETVTITEGQTTNTSETYTVIGSSGSLQVTIIPQAAIDAGAQWRVDGGVWHGSEYTQTGLLAGQHTVGFSDISGLTNPGIQTVMIGEGQTATVTGIYTGQIGSLRVTIIPQGAINAGAHWRVAGGAWHVSGDTQTVSVGSHTVEFSDVTGWTKPNNQTVTISNGQTTNSSGTYTQPTGSLRVTIIPQEAINAGAQWRRVGTGAWRDSGTTETGIPVGQRRVEFKDVPGWTKPGNRTVTISNGQTTNSSGTYTQPTGSLMVMISPQAAIDAGAEWRVDGGIWHGTGDIQTGLLAGMHTIEFSDVAGWAKPGNRTVTINNGQTATLTGNYTTQTGSLQVTISPQGAIDAGAQWRVDGGIWHVSGDLQAGLSVGLHMVDFNSVVGWTKPGNQVVTINNGQTTTATGAYVQQTGSLRVTISPQGAINAGAQWRRVGTSTWLNSDITESGIPVAQHAVEFKDISGWTKPGNQVLTINNGQTTTATGAYVQQLGSLQVTISPQGAINAGAQWRRVGTSTWLNSDITESGIPVGQHAVEFNDVSGWTKPENQTVTISNAQTTTATGAYVQQLGSLQVTINPQGAINAGAQWRRVGMSTWQNSGTTEPGIPVGPYTVEFSDVVGWTKPGNQTVTINNGQTTTTTGAYVQQFGSLQVTINPQGAINAGAQWRRVGMSTWQNSGTTEPGIPVGPYTVEFKDVSGWRKPGNQGVTISNGQTATILGSFTASTASFLFFDDFSTDKGWSGYEGGGWERGPAYAGSPGPGNPDPEADYTATEDNYILGYAIGGNYPNDLLDEKEIISPAIDCTGQDRVFLKFWRYLNVESNESDYARIYISNDRTSWSLIWENPESGTMDNQWTPVVFDISEVAAGEGTVYIKFTMGPTDSAGGYSGWNIDDLEVTSNPVYPAEGTMGTEFTITGSGFGTKKGKVLIGNTPVTVLAWNSVLIRCRLTGVLSPGAYDVTVLPSIPKGSLSIIYYNEAFVVKAPEIYSIDQGYGTAWDQITIRGKFFGTSKGKTYLEYEEGGKPVRKSCNINSWTMDRTTGDSEIVFVVPPMLPEVCDVVVDPYGALPENDEQNGFTVKAPEIISVDRNVGTTGDEITIHGYFFGTKKPKVYLGYNMNGKPRKKPCSVVSWTVVDPTTQEGDIVFKVPGGTALGVYDLIVTNSVGTDAVLGGFALKPPEVVSVDRNAGTAGDEITIHGRFFGIKKGIKGGVYLGYSVEGMPIKKPCSVVSWTVDPATEEGDIVFVVPKGLAPWTYDLIITNSVGSDTEPFTIQ